MQCEVWGGECFLKSQDKSQRFGELVPLHCELSNSFSALSTPLGGTGLLEGAGAGYFPSLGQLGSGESFSCRQALLRRTEHSGVFKNGSFCPPCQGSGKEIFLQYSPGGPGRVTG